MFFKMSEKPSSIRARGTDEATQRKIDTDILSRRWARSGVEVFLDAGEGVEADERLMMPFAEAHIPVGYLDKARIERLLEHLRYLPGAHLAIGQVFGEIRLAFEKTLHLRLGAETAYRITFKRLSDDGG